MVGERTRSPSDCLSEDLGLHALRVPVNISSRYSTCRAMPTTMPYMPLWRVITPAAPTASISARPRSRLKCPGERLSKRENFLADWNAGCACSLGVVDFSFDAHQQVYQEGNLVCFELFMSLQELGNRASTVPPLKYSIPDHHGVFDQRSGGFVAPSTLVFESPWFRRKSIRSSR